MNIKSKKILFILLTLVVFSSAFFFRDLTPDNELKYVSMMKEAFKNKHFLTFYNHGEIYADKPPLYFWILMLVKKITGTYNKVGSGLFSILPGIVICLSMMRITKKELTEEESLLGMGMLTTTIIFLGSSLVLRMDMLMLMFIVLALECFYKIYTRNENKYDVYLIYVYMFLGLFTKGPIGIIFPVITMCLFLARERELKRGREFKPFIGLGIILMLCMIWFIGVYIDGGKEYLYDLTVKQTAGRAYKSFRHVRPFYYYLTGMWGTFLPWSFLYIFTFIVAFAKRLNEKPLEKFLSSAIIGNFIFMSIISSKLEIYLLPVYPFVAFYTLVILKKIKNDKFWQWTVGPFSLLITLTLPGVFIASKFIDIPINMTPLFYMGLGAVSLSGAASLMYLKRKNFMGTAWGIVLGFMILVLTLSFRFPEVNGDLGLKVLATKGMEVSKVESTDNYISFNFEKSINMNFYLDKEVTNIKDLDILKETFETKKVILFIRAKDIKRNEELRDFLSREELIWNSNKYYLYSN